MYTVHATAKLLKRVKQKPGDRVEPDTALGNWYANTVPWRPQTAVFVAESTLLPVFLPLAPAASLLDRFPDQLAVVLDRLGAPTTFIEDERGAMADHCWSKTASRSVLGVMNEFVFLADHYRRYHGQPQPDLVELSVQLSRTPCSPLYGAHTSPDRAVAALIDGHR
jgi:hypothetical protein